MNEVEITEVPSVCLMKATVNHNGMRLFSPVDNFRGMEEVKAKLQELRTGMILDLTQRHVPLFGKLPVHKLKKVEKESTEKADEWIANNFMVVPSTTFKLTTIT